MSLDKLKTAFFFIIYCSLFTIHLSLLTGCAETVSGAKPNAGSTMVVNIKLGADPMLNDYKYVFVYSKSQIAIPVNYYTFLPGQDFDFSTIDLAKSPTSNGTINASKDVFINYYYQNYFSTWSDYIYLTKLGATQTQEFCDPSSPYFPSTANQSINQSFYARNISNESGFSFTNTSGNYDIEFQIELQKLGSESKPATDQFFYFNLFSIDNQGVVVDYYRNSDNTIKNSKGQFVERLNYSTGSYNDLYAIKVTVI